MEINKQEIDYLISRLCSVKECSQRLEERFAEELSQIHPLFKKSALNLLHYIALRRTDVKDVQEKLGAMGISRLGKTESHVMAGINAVMNILYLLKGENIKLSDPHISFEDGHRMLEENSASLLGTEPEGRRVRIMVTLPGGPEDDYDLIYNLISGGMDCARLNCAHDSEPVWGRMVNNIRKANEALGTNCKINMDLGGPKLRTGSMITGPQIIRIQPEKDEFGNVLSQAIVWLAPEGVPSPLPKIKHIPLPEDWLKNIKKGDKLKFKDTRGKNLILKVIEKEGIGRWARCSDSAYLISGTKIYPGDKEKPGIVGELPASDKSIRLRKGDLLILHKDPKPGEPAKFDEEENIIEPAHISCTLPEVFADVRAGEQILLDDGKIEGIIKSVSEEELGIEITYAKEEGTTLKSDKGINLPKSALRIRGLTPKDKEDLKFVAKNSDIVSLSFANSAEDVTDLINALKEMNSELGIIIKIETQRAFENLPGILLAVMKNYPAGIMIARGDLAVECGWKNLAELQEEILMLCEAAHIPNIWATQVLETLAKKGRPSRAEITDAAMSQRAECVMLNKGPHIMDAVELLVQILKSMQDYQQKKSPMLPALKVPHTFDV